jgi:hypothetical protein
MPFRRLDKQPLEERLLYKDLRVQVRAPAYTVAFLSWALI